MNQLKKYLLIKSAFSAISGIVLTFASKTLNPLFHINNVYVLPIVGINLLIFSLVVYYVAIRHLTNNKMVAFISTLDATWAIGSAVIVFGQYFALSVFGYIVILLVAVWIGYLAWMQIKYNRT